MQSARELLMLIHCFHKPNTGETCDYKINSCSKHYMYMSDMFWLNKLKLYRSFILVYKSITENDLMSINIGEPMR